MRVPTIGITLVFLLPVACSSKHDSGFIGASAVHADEATEFRDKVLKAAAKSPDDLAKMRVHTVKAKGLLTPDLNPTPATFEMAAVWPDQFRASWAFSPNKNESTIITVGLANGSGWKSGTNTPQAPLTLEETTDLKMDAYAIWTATLTTLNHIDTKLELAPAAKVGEDSVAGLKLSRKSFPDVTLYFDVKTHLLRKMVYRSRENGVNTTKEMVYSGHKEFNGVMLPTKHSTFVRGKEVYAWTDMDYTMPKSIDSTVFEK